MIIVPLALIYKDIQKEVPLVQASNMRTIPHAQLTYRQYTHFLYMYIFLYQKLMKYHKNLITSTFP
jgi:hypothetical protein